MRVVCALCNYNPHAYMGEEVPYKCRRKMCEVGEHAVRHERLNQGTKDLLLEEAEVGVAYLCHISSTSYVSRSGRAKARLIASCILQLEKLGL